MSCARDRACGRAHRRCAGGMRCAPRDDRRRCEPFPGRRAVIGHVGEVKAIDRSPRRRIEELRDRFAHAARIGRVGRRTLTLPWSVPTPCSRSRCACAFAASQCEKGCFAVRLDGVSSRRSGTTPRQPAPRGSARHARGSMRRLATGGDRIAVNVTVPAVEPDLAAAVVRASRLSYRQGQGR